MQSVSSRIWTRVAVSNYYDDNDYTTGTSRLHHGHLTKVDMLLKKETKSTYCYILTFWPGPKCHSKVMHRKEVTHSNGSYERKSRGRKLADEMGRAKKFPWYTHRLMHRKRVTCELHDSYFRLMTIKHAISKIEWTLNYYVTQLSSGSSWDRRPVELQTVGGEMW